MTDYLLDEELKEAKRDGNPYAKKVGSKKEEEYTKILYNLKQTRDRLAEKIFDLIMEYEGLKDEEMKIEDKIYNISGEWGLVHFDNHNKFPNIIKLYEVIDI